MTIEEVCRKAEEVAQKYNPSNLAPFPYDNIVGERQDLKVLLVELDQDVSGAISFSKDLNKFFIFINKNEKETRRHFTLAHELGHYFLHEELVRKEEVLVDTENFLDGNPALFRREEPELTRTETEANNFAASLIMPEDLVRKAWNALGDIEKCAELFHVSPTAMSIRLERLRLI